MRENGLGHPFDTTLEEERELGAALFVRLDVGRPTKHPVPAERSGQRAKPSRFESRVCCGGHRSRETWPKHGNKDRYVTTSPCVTHHVCLHVCLCAWLNNDACLGCKHCWAQG